MAKTILYIATSLDGQIATKDGSVEWLYSFDKNPDGTPQDHGYEAFVKDIETVVMGSKTYEWFDKAGVPYPYSDKKAFIISKRNLPAPKNGKVTSEEPHLLVRKLKAESQGNIWIVGGGLLVSALLSADLIDEMRLFYIPVMLGEGTSLNPHPAKMTSWKLHSTQSFPTGVIEAVYIR
ncbi:dihydrofolate reductase family protein [Bdellovibrio svalbardensis]|uniref:Dihydrofolate reductase family protein n=1 Tax=Bdellovibrio svalbardensis TaxID=2972972 RepID=A0ABT6DKP3_9BACT|nr:dihydrofolate reductase family protein [Bdellovibrio svalbardensis]MDG0816770.1 dihydrofolate reductase family protein [Bdellovibrio svalbardensis]